MLGGEDNTNFDFILFADENEITGTIPTEMGLLKDLQYLLLGKYSVVTFLSFTKAILILMSFYRFQ